MVRRTATATPKIQVIDGAILLALITAPIPIIGAESTILKRIITTICICCMSLVERVIREEMEKLLNSSIEKLSTFLNTALLRSFENPVPIFAERYPPITAANAPPRVIKIIVTPVLQISARS